MIDNYEKAKHILEKYKQSHIIPFIDKADVDIKEKIINQVLRIDFEELKDLYNMTFEDLFVDLEELQPIAGVNPDNMEKEKLQFYTEIGENVIKNNKFAVATMAGGQGTRLGHPRAKGTYKIDFETGSKYLFEIIVDTLKRANKKYNVIIPWYIMTSNENNADTVEFLKEKNYFGYPKEYVYIFEQGKLPLITEQGKLLIGEDGLIKEASNGNGGIFNSMLKQGAISDMEKRGIEWVFIGSVDNILLKYVDVLLLGLTINDGNEIGTRTVLKRNPEEKVGVLCKQNGKIRVIEYTELPKDIAGIKKENGELVFGESHIMCNLFSINAIKRSSTKELEYHIAFKKSDYLTEQGDLVKPEKENAYKFEQFIFDSFKIFNNISILRGKREEDFAPVKNKSGVDSPDTAKKLYENYWKNNKNVIY